MAVHYGIYGTNYPKLYVPDEIDPFTINLENAVVKTDEPKWQYAVDQAINGHRTVVRIGAHWIVELIYFLYKAGTLAQQHTKADTLQDLKWAKTEFHYYRHADGEAYKDASGTAVLFRLVEFRPFAITNNNYKDAVYLKMISTNYVKVVPTRTY